MNKLFPIAIIILLMLGAAMWSLAPSSFNQYLSAEAQKELSLATGAQVIIGNVDAKSHSGTISGVKAKTPDGTKLFTLESINYTVDKKSYRKPPVKITQLEFVGLDINKDPALRTTLETSLTNYMKQTGLVNDNHEFIVEELIIHELDSSAQPRVIKPVNAEGLTAKALLVEVLSQVLTVAK